MPTKPKRGREKISIIAGQYNGRVYEAKPKRKQMMILAGTFQQYKEFLRANGLTIQDATYVQDRTTLYGHRGFKLIRVGTWYERKDADEIIKESIYRE